MKSWNVHYNGIKIDESSDISWDFVDMDEIIGNYIVFKLELLEVIKKLIEDNGNYNAMSAIDYIIEPVNKKKFLNSYFVIFAQDKEDLSFGFLFLVTNESVGLVAIYPEQAANALKDKSDIIENIMTYLFQMPDHWKTVDLLLPYKSE